MGKTSIKNFIDIFEDARDRTRGMSFGEKGQPFGTHELDIEYVELIYRLDRTLDRFYEGLNEKQAALQDSKNV